jgi:hypothetical protein
MHTYDRLSGASGRRVFYRAERFKARDLFPQATARVEVDNALLALEDLSMTGFSAIAAGSALWAPRIGDEFSVRLLLDDLVLHEGRARVCRIGRQKNGVRVGLGLTSDYLDIAEVISKRNRLLLELEIGGGLVPDAGLVDPAYRKLAADVLHLLRNFRAVLERHERRGNGGSPSLQNSADDALAVCEERMIPNWRQHWEHANAVVAPIMSDPERLRATKRFTELVLTPEFMDGPIWRRSYEKPLRHVPEIRRRTSPASEAGRQKRFPISCARMTSPGRYRLRWSTRNMRRSSRRIARYIRKPRGTKARPPCNA